MNYAQRQAICIVLGILLIAGAGWLWFDNMEQRWTARVQVSDEALKNPMLGAERLLKQHRHTVGIAGTLAEALRAPLPAGTLILLDNGGLITPEQASRLLAWVQRGNTLIVRPKVNPRGNRSSCREQESGTLPARDAREAKDADPIGAAFGVELVEIVRKQKTAQNAPAGFADTEPCLTRLTFPGTRHALQLNSGRFALRSAPGNADPLFGDEFLHAVRVFASGSGHVAFLAQDYFGNHLLPWHDNAELLLNLAALNRNARHVLVIQHLDMPAWYEALWWQFKLGIVSAGIGLALLLWLSVRRFGPLLPEPDNERRSLIEHIDASGRWLWKTPGGRNILLNAVRHSTENVLMRKVPALQRLSPAERAGELARQCKLPAGDVASALLEPAAKLPIDFTRQIQTLQQLRKHHER